MLAEIFNGTITTWNDPKLAKLNFGASLPGDKIMCSSVRESGTTENTTKFLPKAGNGAWKDEPAKADRHCEGKEQVLRRLRRDDHSGTPSPTARSYAGINNPWQIPDRRQQWRGRADRRVGRQGGRRGVTSGSGNDLALELKYTDNEAGAYLPAGTHEITAARVWTRRRPRSSRTSPATSPRSPGRSRSRSGLRLAAAELLTKVERPFVPSSTIAGASLETSGRLSAYLNRRR